MTYVSPNLRVGLAEGQEHCHRCGGLGKVSLYDQGWKSLMHCPSLAAKIHTCLHCMGSGIEPSGTI